MVEAPVWLVYFVALVQGLLFGTWLGFMLDKWVRCRAVEKIVAIMEQAPPECKKKIPGAEKR